MSRYARLTGRLGSWVARSSLTVRPYAEEVGARRASSTKGLCRLISGNPRPLPSEHAAVAPLSFCTRDFSSFHGSTRQFDRDVHKGDVIVFFYKPACGPCAVIREKIITAAGRLGAVHSTPSPSGPQLVVDGVGRTDEEPAQAAAESGPTDAMSPEDRAAWDQLREHLRAGTESGEPYRLRFVAVNTNENDLVTALHDVRSLPTFVAYHNGKIVGRAEGAQEADLLALVKALKDASMGGTTSSHDES